jgi:hypothetical protein
VPVVFGTLLSLQCSMVIGAGIHFLVTSSPLGISGARYFVLGMWAFSWCVGGCRCLDALATNARNMPASILNLTLDFVRVHLETHQ